MQEYEKRYVPVVTYTNEDGRVRVDAIHWFDGTRYRVLRVDDDDGGKRQAATRVGSTGICHTIRIGDRWTKIWQEGSRWFVEAKADPFEDV